MYLLKRLFFILILLTSGIILIQQGYIFFKWLESAEPLSLRSNDETRSLVHWLDEQTPLVYNYNPARVEQLRILSNAIFDQSSAPDPLVNYAIDYQILDKDNKVILQHRYHHASKLVDSTEASQVKQLIEDRQALKVASGQSFYVSKADLALGQTISLKVILEHPTLKGVVIRMHAKVPELEKDLERAWLQLPEERKSRILGYHTLGKYAVSPQEIAQSVRFSWLKLAPQGVPKIDFKDDILYEHLPYNVKTYDFDTEQLDLNAIYTDSQLKASLPIENTTQFYVNTATATELSVVWYDKTQISPPKALHLTRLDQGQWQTPIIEPGLIVISSAEMQLSRWYASDGNLVNLLHSYYYELNNDTSAFYPVSESIAARLEFRPMQNTTATLRFLNDKQVIQSKQLQLYATRSMFDRSISNQTTREAISDSVFYYLQVPKGVTSLEISTADPTWFKLSHRLEQGLSQTRLCSLTCEDRTLEQISSWFSLAASNDFEFVANDKTKKVRLFQAPPEPISEDYFYESIDLTDYAQRSNTALIYSPWRYFDSPPAPEAFRYTLWDGQQQAYANLFSEELSQARVVQKNQQQKPKVVALPLLDYVATNKPVESSTTRYISMKTGANWTETRLYQLPAKRLIRLPLPATGVSRIYIKPFVDNPNAPFLLKTFLNARKKLGVSEQYTVTRQHAILDASNGMNTVDAFLLHPTQPDLISYPTQSIIIGNDIAQLNHLDIVSEQPVWINVTLAMTNMPSKINWRQTDNE